MPFVRSISVIYLGRKRWLWSGFGRRSFRAFLGGEIWPSSGSESDLTSTYNSKSASKYMPAVDPHSEELSALPMTTAPLKDPMEQVVQKQIPINLQKREM